MPEPANQSLFDQALKHHSAGHLSEAERLYRQIIALDPTHADAHKNLGMALQAAGQRDAAIIAYQAAIALRPDFAEVHNNLGIAFRAAGKFDEAAAAFQNAVNLQPNIPQLHSNLGNAFRDQRKFDLALSAFQRAIALQPNLPEAHNNLGIALKDFGSLDEAIAAYRQAIALNPKYAKAFFNLGNALAANDDSDAAIAAYQNAIDLDPNYTDAFCNLGNALKDRGELDASIEALRKAIALAPRNAAFHSNLINTLHYHPNCDASSLAAECDRWNERHAKQFAHSLSPPPTDWRPDRPLRIGYVSADFRTHACAHCLVPLLEHHDREQFQIVCYSNVSQPDAITARLRNCASIWRDIAGMSDDDVAAQIREDRIDILVDLNLHTAGNRLLVFACKPAPIQISWLGYPGTTGLRTIDFHLTTACLEHVTENEPTLTDKPFRLPDTFWCYDPLDDGDVAATQMPLSQLPATRLPAAQVPATRLPVSPLPAIAAGYITFGCLNNFCKINPPVLLTWASVLREVPNSRLLLLTGPGSHRDSVLNLLRDEGVQTDRVEFAPRRPRRDYLKLFDRIDISLDSFPYNGHTTTLDSLWMGVPLITLAGPYPICRAGQCFLSHLDLNDLSSTNAEQFIHAAAHLARDIPHLAHLRSTLRPRLEQSPLMNAQKFAFNIETAYRTIWQTHRPDHP